MSINVDLNIGVSPQLLELSNRAAQANRSNLSRRELEFFAKKEAKKAKDATLVRRAFEPSSRKGTPIAGRSPSRYLLVGSTFGLYTVYTGAEEEDGFSPDLPQDGEIRLERMSSLSTIEAGVVVIYIGTRISCFVYDKEDWFGGALEQLADFARLGGIVVINSEWGGCGFRRQNELASDVNSAFGTSINQRADIDDVVDDFVELKQNELSSFMPQRLRVAGSGTFSGGKPLYQTTGGRVVSAYERVGRGALVRLADSNEDGGNPTKRVDLNGDPILDGEGRVTSFAEGLVRWQNRL